MKQKNTPSETRQDRAASEISHIQWLAGRAMQAILTRSDGIPDSEAEREEIALWSYRMAQAMKKMESRIKLGETEDTS